MTNEVFFDASGFSSVMEERDDLHQKAVEWLLSRHVRERDILENSPVQRLGRS